jgi:hypothetical protein
MHLSSILFTITLGLALAGCGSSAASSVGTIDTTPPADLVVNFIDCVPSDRDAAVGETITCYWSVSNLAGHKSSVAVSGEWQVQDPVSLDWFTLTTIDVPVVVGGASTTVYTTTTMSIAGTFKFRLYVPQDLDPRTSDNSMAINLTWTAGGNG